MYVLRRDSWSVWKPIAMKPDLVRTGDLAAESGLPYPFALILIDSELEKKMLLVLLGSLKRCGVTVFKPPFAVHCVEMTN